VALQRWQSIDRGEGRRLRIRKKGDLEQRILVRQDQQRANYFLDNPFSLSRALLHPWQEPAIEADLLGFYHGIHLISFALWSLVSLNWDRGSHPSARGFLLAVHERFYCLY
jgi:hypothetical protein